LGDTATFGHDSWATVDAKWAYWSVYIRQGNSDVSGGTGGSESGPAGDVEHKTQTSPRFTATGNWYWGMKVRYPDASVVAWYCRNDSTWQNMYGTPDANLTVDVSALNNPSGQTATQGTNPNSDILLSWSKDAQSHNVMIVRKTSSQFWTEPTQGTAYSVGTDIGSGKVVYNSSDTSYENTGLSLNTTYDYKFYSENNSYYAAGVTAQATTTPEPGACMLAGLLLIGARAGAKCKA